MKIIKKEKIMKKIIAFLFAGTLLTAGVFAAEINVNGVFKGAKEGGKNSPRWILRTDAEGKVEFVKGEKAPLALKVVPGKTKISCISKAKINAKAGDILTVSSNGKGKGIFQLSAYVYGKGGKYLTTLQGKKLSATEKNTPFTQDLKVAASGEIAYVTAVIVVQPSSDITFEDVKVIHNKSK